MAKYAPAARVRNLPVDGVDAVVTLYAGRRRGRRRYFISRRVMSGLQNMRNSQRLPRQTDSHK